MFKYLTEDAHTYARMGLRESGPDELKSGFQQRHVQCSIIHFSEVPRLGKALFQHLMQLQP